MKLAIAALRQIIRCNMFSRYLAVHFRRGCSLMPPLFLKNVFSRLYTGFLPRLGTSSIPLKPWSAKLQRGGMFKIS